MEDNELKFEEAKIIFQNLGLRSTSTVPNTFGEHKYFAGQLIQFNVEIPVRKIAIQNAKISHQPRSPASSNLLRCFLRHIASTVEVKASVDVNQKEIGHTTNNLTHETAKQISCLLESTQSRKLSNTETGLFKTEPYLKEGTIYTVPFQLRIQNIPPQSDTVELIVEIRQGQRHAPGWLSSPTRSDPVVFSAGNDNCLKRLKKRLKVVHPPKLEFQHKTVSGKQIMFMQVSNSTSQPITVEGCSLLPESCPVKLCKQSTGLQAGDTRKPCLIHGNMVKLLNTEAEALPVSLLSGENVSLLYSLHLVGGTDYLARKEIPFLCHLKWNTLDNTGHPQSDVTSIYSLPTLKMKQAYFVLSAKCKEEKIWPGDSFTVTYSINNRLQDFLSIKLYWSPSFTAGTMEQLECLKQGLLCCDPKVQLGACSYGNVLQAEVRFQALRPGLYEVCKHMKINLRYLIPTDSDQLSSPATHLSPQSGDERLPSEEIWRGRSGSGSSFREPEGSEVAENRLSLANKSYSVGDLVDKSPKGKSKLPLTMVMKGSNSEHTILNPENFLKNSCEVYVQRL